MRAVARRVARDIPDGSYVNLGIGLPTLVADCVGSDKEIVYHSENGILGMGPAPAPGEEDPELINAGKQPVTLLPGGAFFHHTDAFLMMRGGHVDLTVLGAFQVSEAGDLANWATDDASHPPAVGGAMDLVAGVKKIIVVMEHTSKNGDPKFIPACTLPLTGRNVVDMIITDLCVFQRADHDSPFRLIELAPGVSAEEVETLLRITDVMLENARKMNDARGFVPCGNGCEKE